MALTVTPRNRGWFARVLRVRDLDDVEAVEAALERAIVKPAPKRRRVNREPRGALSPALAPVNVELINWDAVALIRRKAAEEGTDVVAILERVIRRMREDDDRDDEEAIRWLL